MRVAASFVLTALLCVRGSDDSDDEALTPYTVEHSLSAASDGRRVFTSRGTMYYRDPRAQSAGDRATRPLSSAKISLSGSDMDDFKGLVANNGTYAVRVKTQHGPSVMAFTHACALAASNFREEWEVTMDQFGSIIAINYNTRNSDCAGVDARKLAASAELQTSVKVLYPWRGIRPEVKPGQGVPQQPGAPAPSGDASSQGGGKEGDAPKEEQSFLQKYWMYIAIAVIFMMMNNLPEEGGAPGSRPGGAGPRAAPRRRPASGAS